MPAIWYCDTMRARALTLPLAKSVASSSGNKPFSSSVAQTLALIASTPSFIFTVRLRLGFIKARETCASSSSFWVP